MPRQCFDDTSSLRTESKAGRIKRSQRKLIFLKRPACRAFVRCKRLEAPPPGTNGVDGKPLSDRARGRYFSMGTVRLKNVCGRVCPGTEPKVHDLMFLHPHTCCLMKDIYLPYHVSHTVHRLKNCAEVLSLSCVFGLCSDRKIA